MSKELWIYAEQTEGTVSQSYFEMLSKAVSIYNGNTEVPKFTAVVLSDDEEVIPSLANSGADKVICLVSKAFDNYRPEESIDAITKLAQERKPETILFAASQIGSELAPSVAARLNTGLCAHCTDLSIGEDGLMHMMIPAFGGKLMCDDYIPTARPMMASIKPGVFERVELEAKSEEIEVINADELQGQKGISLLSATPKSSENRAIEDADIVFCLGLGAGDQEVIQKIQRLAGKVNAGVAYTRPMVDLGYFPDESSMVGTSGKTIKPKLYVGFGVGGASHHICGMKDSKTIININNDEEAACFAVSDYTVIADCEAIAAELESLL